MSDYFGRIDIIYQLSNLRYYIQWRQKMENGQTTIKSLFDGRVIFNIPKYQRAYAWGEKQINEFVDDIENQDINKDYFLGTILFQDQGMADEFDHIDIVDGQQRITTLIIYMKLLIDQLEVHKVKTTTIEMLRDTYIQYKKYKLRVLQDDNAFFTSYILENHALPNGQIRTPSQRRLYDAKEILFGRIKKLSPATLLELKDKIERMRVLTYSVKGNAEATQIFETTNDRGKSLTDLEKTKSFLMYNMYLVSKTPDPSLESLQERFSDIYRDYEIINNKNKTSIKLGEDAILQYHCIAFEEWTSKHEYREPVQMIKDQVNQLVKNDEKSKAKDFIDRCSRELNESFAIVRKLLESDMFYLLDIYALNRAAVCYSLLIKAFKLDQSKQKQNFDKIARLSEIICFRLGIGGYRIDRGRNRLYEISKDFNGDFDALIGELNDFVNKFCNDSDFQHYLCSSRFNEEINDNDQMYLYWKYENYLRKNEQPIFPELSYDDFRNKDPKTKFTIEHIIPQNPEKNKVVEDNSKSILPLMTSEFEEKYLHSIGNLTIDPLSANSSKSNKNFKQKDQNYFRKAPLKTQNELIDFLNDKNGKWDEESIETRTKKILKFAMKYWDPSQIN